VVQLYPLRIATRWGIKYSLDLRETIDFATYFSAWEPETMEFINRYVSEGDWIIEIGSNVGIHTLLLAKKSAENGKVIAFEPTDFAHGKLLVNINLNPSLRKNISVRKQFVTDKKLSVPSTAIRSSYRMNLIPIMSDTNIDQKIAISIDELSTTDELKALDILKVDVDGFELKILQGAIATIEKFLPIIYIELDKTFLNLNGDSPEAIFHFLLPMGYSAYFADGHSPITDLQALNSKFELHTHFNVIFSPKSRRSKSVEIEKEQL